MPPLEDKRMRNLLLFSTILLLVLAGCIKDDRSYNNTDINFTQVQLKSFLDAGCVNSSYDYLDCEKTSFTSEFNCDGSTIIRKEGAYLDPQVPLARCFTSSYGANLTEGEQETYFYCSGGLRYGCTSYIHWNGSTFVQIKNTTDFSGLITPITSEQEALYYVLLSKNVVFGVDRKILGNLNSKAEKRDGGFLVTTYYYNPFGCYDSLDYYEIRYQVSQDGEIIEKDRKVVYTEALGYSICVD